MAKFVQKLLLACLRYEPAVPSMWRQWRVQAHWATLWPRFFRTFQCNIAAADKLEQCSNHFFACQACTFTAAVDYIVICNFFAYFVQLHLFTYCYFPIKALALFYWHVKCQLLCNWNYDETIFAYLCLRVFCANCKCANVATASARYLHARHKAIVLSRASNPRPHKNSRVFIGQAASNIAELPSCNTRSANSAKKQLRV
ncbi:MAG: hypothetical protein FD128_494 [Hyphomonadaceae bacterium]|nr:MAG: hypothetical protein FD128_494 [Hyphomonadaceae bacterium]